MPIFRVRREKLGKTYPRNFRENPITPINFLFSFLGGGAGGGRGGKNYLAIKISTRIDSDN